MRIAAIRYINALPLIFGLGKDLRHDLLVDTPSACYKHLIDGTVDVALIPVFGTQTHAGVLAVRDLGIAAVRTTESVLLFSRQPIDKIQTVFTDPGSLTSVNLLKIILNKKYGIKPHFATGDMTKLDRLLERFDAALIIGDEAILMSETPCFRYDLATEWNQMTGLPFIFAVWGALRPLSESERGALQHSYEEAEAHFDEVLDEAGKILPVDRDFLKRYYNLNLHYQLTPGDYRGFSEYLTLAAEQNVLMKVRTDIWM